MNRTVFCQDSVPIATRLLDTHDCLELCKPINDFENAMFGPDFACNDAQIKSWVDSGCLFYAAVCGEAVLSRRNILSVVSVFITTSRSRDQMLAGHIPECELMPWTAGSRSAQPSIYFSSVVSDAPHHLVAMYASLRRDVEEFREDRGLSFFEGFGIASGEAGRLHMENNGFRRLEHHHYRGKYDLLAINERTARTEFWRGLLRDEPVCFRAVENGKSHGHPVAVSAEPLLAGSLCR